VKGRFHGTFLSRRDRRCRMDLPFLLSPQFYSSWTDDEKHRGRARVRFQSLSRRRYHSGQNHPIVVLLSAKRTFQTEGNVTAYSRAQRGDIFNVGKWFRTFKGAGRLICWNLHRHQTICRPLLAAFGGWGGVLPAPLNGTIPFLQRRLG
jgi:hypothetical protein